MATPVKNPIMVLQELTVRNRLKRPDYQITSSQSGTHDNRFDYVVFVAGIRANGSGPSKQIGRHQAAQNALKILHEMGVYNPAENPVTDYLSYQKDESTLENGLTYIIKLQATCSKNKIPLPDFLEISNEGPPHDRKFTMGCKIYSFITKASAKTKRMAKQLAAKEMLERITEIMVDLIIKSRKATKELVYNNDVTTTKCNKATDATNCLQNDISDCKQDPTMAPTTKTPVMVLQELTVQKGLPPPNFQIVYSISGTHDNRFDYQVCVAGITATGSGPSKQIGKHEAAHNALKLLEEIGLYNPAENPVAEFRPSLKDGSPLKSALNSIVELQNICLENKIPPPEFIEISSIGPAHAKEFTLQCRISSIVTESTANTKKLAKQLAARDMLDKVKNIMPELITESDMGKKKFLQEHEEVIAKYNFLNNVIPDKCVQVNDMPNTLKKLMVLKDIQYEDLKEDLEERSEEALKRILEKLEVEYELFTFQENPLLVALVLKIDTPFVILGRGENFEICKRRALEQTFDKMKLFFQLEI